MGGIKKIVFGLKNGKRLGSDKMTLSFYKAYWNIVGDSVIKAVQFFFTHGHLLKALNNTFITLVPKNDHSKRVDQYRPIALPYKIITKLIAESLKLILDNITAPSHSVFVPNRGMVDNIIILHEIMYNLK